MKYVFITGAAGFIGGYIVNQFVKEGWHVLALVRRRASTDLERLADENRISIIRGDLEHMASIETALRNELEARHTNLDVLVHCAGRASDTGRRSEFRKTNYESVNELVQMSNRMNLPRFVFISTTDVYGLFDFHGEPENELPLKARPSNPYPEYKIKAEQMIRRELPPERFAIIRPAQVWGVGDRTLTPRIVDFLRSSPWIVHFGKWRGQNRWPLAHVRNVALTTFLAAVSRDPVCDAVNIIDDEQTTMEEFYRILADLYLPQKKFKSITLPFGLGQLFSCLISSLSNLLNLDQPFTDPSFYALYAVSHNLDFDNHRMKKLIAQADRSLFTRDEGIREIREHVPSALSGANSNLLRKNPEKSCAENRKNENGRRP